MSRYAGLSLDLSALTESLLEDFVFNTPIRPCDVDPTFRRAWCFESEAHPADWEFLLACGCVWSFCDSAKIMHVTPHMGEDWNCHGNGRKHPRKLVRIVAVERIR